MFALFGDGKLYVIGPGSEHIQIGGLDFRAETWPNGEKRRCRINGRPVSPLRYKLELREIYTPRGRG